MNFAENQLSAKYVYKMMCAVLVLFFLILEFLLTNTVTPRFTWAIGSGENRLNR